MIVFDLRCTAGHVFEAWFGSSADYESQRERALVACPLCGDTAIDKAVMAPNVVAKGNRRAETLPAAGKPDPRQLMAALAEAQAKMLEGSKWVGVAFAEGFDKAMIQRCLTLDFGQAICGTVAATGRPMHVADIQNTLDPIADLVRSAGINAYACEPLMVGDRLLGTISFASRERKRFEIEDLLFFRSIAKHVALARDRARKQNREMAQIVG